MKVDLTAPIHWDKTDLRNEPNRLNAAEAMLLQRINGYGLSANANYLTKCQVDTPPSIVKMVWKIVSRYRKHVGTVFDAGAGDGRFSIGGNYSEYTGYELDPKRIPITPLPSNARILRADAFSGSQPRSFDLAIGNPPYVRHHDLSDAWRENISKWIEEQTGVRPNGWSNAYLYFLWLALINTKDDGLVVYLVPFDWVTRPAARSFREYISHSGWELDIYRFDKEPFPEVLTTACIAVINKRATRNKPRYFRLTPKGAILPISNPTLTSKRPLSYKNAVQQAFAKRGLSPGDQNVFLLNESDRSLHKLKIGTDVVPAVSSLRHIEDGQIHLTEAYFDRHFIKKGVRCWLIKPSDSPTKQLLTYLKASAAVCQHNSTCSKRESWWKFTMPEVPRIVYASGFRGARPKMLVNDLGVIAVGSVCGIYSTTLGLAKNLFTNLQTVNFDSQVVAMSRGFTKIEVNQMNGLLQSFMD